MGAIFVNHLDVVVGRFLFMEERAAIRRAYASGSGQRHRRDRQRDHREHGGGCAGAQHEEPGKSRQQEQHAQGHERCRRAQPGNKQEHRQETTGNGAECRQRVEGASRIASGIDIDEPKPDRKRRDETQQRHGDGQEEECPNQGSVERARIERAERLQ